MRRSSRRINDFGDAGRLAGAIGRHPREFVGLLTATVAVAAIFVNALFLQQGPRPAPIFATKPAAVQDMPVVLPRPRAAEPAAPPAPAARGQAQIIGDIQRELNRKGFYDGAVDGIWGARTDTAARDFAQTAGLKISTEASEALLHAVVASTAKAPGKTASPTRNDPIAELIAPTKQVLAIQRALSDFGYGQIKPTGVLDPATQAGIEKFERDRKLPVTGQISEQLIRELSAMTGRPLE